MMKIVKDFLRKHPKFTTWTLRLLAIAAFAILVVATRKTLSLYFYIGLAVIISQFLGVYNEVVTGEYRAQLQLTVVKNLMLNPTHANNFVRFLIVLFELTILLSFALGNYILWDFRPINEIKMCNSIISNNTTQQIHCNSISNDLECLEDSTCKWGACFPAILSVAHSCHNLPEHQCRKGHLCEWYEGGALPNNAPFLVPDQSVFDIVLNWVSLNPHGVGYRVSLVLFLAVFGAQYALHMLPTLVIKYPILKNVRSLGARIVFGVLFFPAVRTFMKTFGCLKPPASEHSYLKTDPATQCGVPLQQLSALFSFLMIIGLTHYALRDAITNMDPSQNDTQIPAFNVAFLFVKLVLCAIPPFTSHSNPFVSILVVCIANAVLLLWNLKTEPVLGVGVWVNNFRTGTFLSCFYVSFLSLLQTPLIHTIKKCSTPIYQASGVGAVDCFHYHWWFVDNRVGKEGHVMFILLCATPVVFLAGFLLAHKNILQRKLRWFSKHENIPSNPIGTLLDVVSSKDQLVESCQVVLDLQAPLSKALSQRHLQSKLHERGFENIVTIVQTYAQADKEWQFDNDARRSLSWMTKTAKNKKSRSNETTPKTNNNNNNNVLNQSNAEDLLQISMEGMSFGENNRDKKKGSTVTAEASTDSAGVVVLAALLVARSLPKQHLTQLTNRGICPHLYKILTRTKHEEILDSSAYLLALLSTEASLSSSSLSGSTAEKMEGGNFREGIPFSCALNNRGSIFCPAFVFERLVRFWGKTKMALDDQREQQVDYSSDDEEPSALDEILEMKQQQQTTTTTENTTNFDQQQQQQQHPLRTSSATEASSTTTTNEIGSNEYMLNEKQKRNERRVLRAEMRAVCAYGANWLRVAGKSASRFVELETVEAILEILMHTAVTDSLIKIYCVEMLSYICGDAALVEKIAANELLDAKLINTITAVLHHTTDKAPIPSEPSAEISSFLKKSVQSSNGHLFHTLDRHVTPVRLYHVTEDVLWCVVSLVKSASSIPKLRTTKLPLWTNSLVSQNFLEITIELLRRRDSDSNDKLPEFTFAGQKQGFLVNAKGSRGVVHKGYGSLVVLNGRRGVDWHVLVLKVIEQLSVTTRGVHIVKLNSGLILSLVHTPDLMARARVVLTGLTVRENAENALNVNLQASQLPNVVVELSGGSNDVNTKMQQQKVAIGAALSLNIRKIRSAKTDAELEAPEIQSQLQKTRTLGLLGLIVESEAQAKVLENIRVLNKRFDDRFKKDDDETKILEESLQQLAKRNQQFVSIFEQRQLYEESETETRQREAGTLLGSVIASDPENFIKPLMSPNEYSGQELAILVRWFKNNLKENQPQRLRGILATFNTAINQSHEMRTFLIAQGLMSDCFELLTHHIVKEKGGTKGMTFSMFSAIVTSISQMLAFGEQCIRELRNDYRKLQEKRDTNRLEEIRKQSQSQPQQQPQQQQTQQQPQQQQLDEEEEQHPVEQLIRVIEKLPPEWSKEMKHIVLALCSVRDGVLLLNECQFFETLLNILEKIDIDSKWVILELMAVYLRSVAFLEESSYTQQGRNSDDFEEVSALCNSIFSEEQLMRIIALSVDSMFWGNVIFQKTKKVPRVALRETKRKYQQFWHHKEPLPHHKMHVITANITHHYLCIHFSAVLESISFSSSGRSALFSLFGNPTTTHIFDSLFHQVQSIVMSRAPDGEEDAWAEENTTLLCHVIQALHNFCSHNVGLCAQNDPNNDHIKVWEILDISKLKNPDKLNSGVVLFMESVFEGAAVSEELLVLLLDAVSDPRSSPALQHLKKSALQCYQMMCSVQLWNANILHRFTPKTHEDLVLCLKNDCSGSITTAPTMPELSALSLDTPHQTPKQPTPKQQTRVTLNVPPATLRGGYSQLDDNEDLTRPVDPTKIKRINRNKSMRKKKNEKAKKIQVVNPVLVAKQEMVKFERTKRFKAKFFQLAMQRFWGDQCRLVLCEIVTALMSNPHYKSVVENLVEIWLSMRLAPQHTALDQAKRVAQLVTQSEGQTLAISTVGVAQLESAIATLVDPCVVAADCGGSETTPAERFIRIRLNSRAIELRKSMATALFGALASLDSWNKKFPWQNTSQQRQILLRLVISLFARNTLSSTSTNSTTPPTPTTTAFRSPLLLTKPANMRLPADTVFCEFDPEFNRDSVAVSGFMQNSVQDSNNRLSLPTNLRDFGSRSVVVPAFLADEPWINGTHLTQLVGMLNCDGRDLELVIDALVHFASLDPQQFQENPCDAPQKLIRAIEDQLCSECTTTEAYTLQAHLLQALSMLMMLQLSNGGNKSVEVFFECGGVHQLSALLLSSAPTTLFNCQSPEHFLRLMDSVSTHHQLHATNAGNNQSKKRQDVHLASIFVSALRVVRALLTSKKGERHFLETNTAKLVVWMCCGVVMRYRLLALKNVPQAMRGIVHVNGKGSTLNTRITNTSITPVQQADVLGMQPLVLCVQILCLLYPSVQPVPVDNEFPSALTDAILNNTVLRPENIQLSDEIDGFVCKSVVREVLGLPPVQGAVVVEGADGMERLCELGKWLGVV